jgi:hypothetical protein
LSVTGALSSLVTATAPLVSPRPTPRPSARATPGPTEPADLMSNSQGMLFLLLMGGIFLVGYVVSLALHPNTKCRVCKGAGFHRGGMFSYATRPCKKCGGRALKPRLGRRIFMANKS